LTSSITKVRPAGFRRAGVEHAGDVGVVHERQGLALGFEAGDDVARVHSRLDDLERDLAAHGMLLLGDEHQAHAPLADLLHQLVGPDYGAGPLGDRLVIVGRICGRRPAHEFAGFAVIPEQTFDLGPKASVRAASLLEICGSIRRRADLQGAAKNGLHVGRCDRHRPASNRGCSTLNATCRPEDCTRREKNSGQVADGDSPSRQRKSQARA
jgi:hypothetical protein